MFYFLRYDVSFTLLTLFLSENETQFNSFLFNSTFTCAISAATVQIALVMFWDYTKGSAIALIALKVQNSDFFFTIYNVSFFYYILVIFSIFTLIGLIMAGANRIRYGDVIKGKEQQEKNDALNVALNPDDSDND